MYVVYWPEETTWNDSASGSVKKNRVTFMRYLTRLADQIRVLISDEHADALVWKNAKDYDSDDDLDASDLESDNEDIGGRFFKFEVAKTKEEEESVQVRDGFSVSCAPCHFRSRLLSHYLQLQHTAFSSSVVPIPVSNASPVPTTLGPRSISGEERQAFLTSSLLHDRHDERRVEGKYYSPRLRSEL